MLRFRFELRHLKLADERRDLRGALSHRNRNSSGSEIRGNRQNRSRRKIQGSFLPFFRADTQVFRGAGRVSELMLGPVAFLQRRDNFLMVCRGQGQSVAESPLFPALPHFLMAESAHGLARLPGIPILCSLPSGVFSFPLRHDHCLRCIVNSAVPSAVRPVLRTIIALCCTLLISGLLTGIAAGQAITNTKYRQADKFRQLEELLPTPNDYRTASGAPGHRYWQQKVDYEIDVELDDATQRIRGREVITYTNNSPDTLTYLWLQLDANMKQPQSGRSLAAPAPSLSAGLSYNSLDSLLTGTQFDGSVKVKEVLDVASGVPLPHVVVKTSLRVDLPRGLKTGEQFRFAVAWEYAINNSKVSPGRTGYEYFEEDKNYLYEMAQWFPRLCAYSDAVGWQHKEYLGSGEFALEFGDYVVRITVPDDHKIGRAHV